MSGELSSRSFLVTTASVYIILLVITVFSFVVIEADWFINHLPKRSAEILVIMLVGLKASLITDYFMELHYAPKWLRGSMYFWILAVSGALIFIIMSGLRY
ncbi:cytochrome C oxidase subunit IV family protein [Zhongshania arctica]|uniref:Cytochrome C oxidase subunit IV family protein n=1 Tax=Zhongshania arctica TaxID=3238302 RepID=A0ABV3U169_9GAMM